ncbi:CheR family methyltransferase [Piscinibacter terrae]|uniref:Protein-glutamate O-methyltransferase CheR n=1 Tax=Piscinibacter terrae TaxID=2496871 RepID=A0A3N7HL66_9BURK|nr:protein-glutamate O-methyltransferase CheR [Albitalea terrae]RQP22858.1 protein-glutamate O-methyltransferase CheR [Albitalea terrae]
MTHRVGDALIRAFSDKVAAQMGMRFGANRHDVLLRAANALAQRAGATCEAREIQQWLVRPWNPADIQSLAELFSVGETYFFRDPAAFDILEHELLPPMIVQRRESTRRLRVWSAGCSTGEEAYSLAVMLSRLIPDHAQWDIEVWGTDIHMGFLARAREATYGDWSFRGVPDLVREQYFHRLDADRLLVKDLPRTMVRFEYANVMEPPLSAQPFDIILCRNVLIYFGRQQARQAVAHLRGALADGGLLLVAPTEAGARCFDGFEAVRYPNALFHRKAALSSDLPAPPARLRPDTARLKPALDRSLDDAISRCEAALARDKLDAALHVQHAALLEEAHRPEQARDALRRALFLEPELTLARSALQRLSDQLGHRHGRHRSHEVAQ